MLLEKLAGMIEDMEKDKTVERKPIIYSELPERLAPFVELVGAECVQVTTKKAYAGATGYLGDGFFIGVGKEVENELREISSGVIMKRAKDLGADIIVADPQPGFPNAKVAQRYLVNDKNHTVYSATRDVEFYRIEKASS